MSRKIIIDTDPGVDDTMAIFYALRSPELEILGLTSVFGNGYTDICTTNALRLLEIAGRPEIPVSAGAQRPLAMPFRGPADFVHGADAQGNVNLPQPKGKPTGLTAAQFLVETARKQSGEITLVALGPLTNLALAMLLDPHFDTNLKEIILMGGSAYAPGNVSPAAEANIINDPEAADIVFGAACLVTMVGLDVTHKIFMPDEVLNRFSSMPSAMAQHVGKVVKFYRDFFHSRYGMNGIYVHDSTTITFMLKPSIFQTVFAPVRVDTSQGISRGKTWAGLAHSDHEAAWESRRPVQICTEVDVKAAIQLEIERMEG